jgi:CRP/FNR family cyclic AMP-dependent transcriptional regulator
VPSADIIAPIAAALIMNYAPRPTTSGKIEDTMTTSPATRGAPIEALQRVPLFSDMNKREIQEIARLFKEHRFSKGETIVKEGSVADTLFLIESGEAAVFIGGRGRLTMKAPDYFGEVALIDEGTRMATAIASSEVVCYGLTYRDFRALVEKSGVVGWKLLQRMVKMLRATRAEAHELEDALGTFRRIDDRYPG